MPQTLAALSGMGRLSAVVSDPDAVVIRGMASTARAARHDDVEDIVKLKWTKTREGLWRHRPVYRHNAFVTNGLNAVLERIGGVGTTAALSNFVLAANTSAVTLATTKIDPVVTHTSFKVFSPAYSVNAATSVATAGATYTQADISWVITKMGLANTTTDAGTTTAGAIAGVWDIIGGTGGSSPYNQAFSADYTGSTSFTLSPSIALTAAAT